MGNDGGSIPKRRELVKEAARNPTTAEVKEALQEQQEYGWTTDPLSNKPLAKPIVSDSLGRLYNKDSILEYLLSSEDSNKAEAEKILQGAVKSLKDIVEVKFELDKDIDTKQNGSSKTEQFICPLTSKPLGAGSKAVYLVPCGHAFSAVAIKEISGDSEGKCLQCNESYAPNDVIPILPTLETDIARLQLRMKSLKENGLSHSLKKDKGAGKKRKKDGDKETTKDRSKGDVSAVKAKVSKTINNAATASLTARVLEEQEARNKRQKLEANENIKSLFSKNGKNGLMNNNSDFMTRGFSVPAKQK